MFDRPQRSRILATWSLALAAGVLCLLGPRAALADANGRSYGGCNCHSGGSGTTTASVTFAPNPVGTGADDVLTLTVTNSALSGAGFSMQASAGTFGTTQPAGVKRLSATNVTHSAPSTAKVWTINWTAPASPATVTFNVQAVAVNMNNGTSGDKPLASAYSTTLAVTSGTTQQDAGTTQQDAGATQQDAATTQQDSAAAGQDAGGTNDGGIILTVPDGGAADAAAGGDDGGTNPPGNAGGCAVAAGGAAAAPLALLLLAGLIVARRRRR